MTEVSSLLSRIVNASEVKFERAQQLTQLAAIEQGIAPMRVKCVLTKVLIFLSGSMPRYVSLGAPEWDLQPQEPLMTCLQVTNSCSLLNIDVAFPSKYRLI